MAQRLTYLLCFAVCALLSGFCAQAAEVATCDEIAECILWTEGACTAEGSREVCFKTGNSETTGLGDCTLGDGEFIDGACFVADVTNPGDLSSNQPLHDEGEESTDLCKTVAGGSTVVLGVQHAIATDTDPIDYSIPNELNSGLTRTVSCSGHNTDQTVCVSPAEGYALVSFHVTACVCECTEWTDWSGCIGTCGAGEKTRTRTCDPPSDAYICPETTQETATCDTGIACPDPVCVCGDFGAWSDCSASCGDGTQERSKSCTLDSDDSACTLNGVEMSETQTCKIADCTTATPTCLCDVWSVWGECSALCGGGHQNRTRSCHHRENSAALGCSADVFTMESQACNTDACTPGTCDDVCSGWAISGSCSVTCGSGMAEMTRTCPGNSHCLTAMMAVCTVQPECVGVVDGNWSPWMTWGECPTTTCTGVRQRTRECVNPPPSNGGTGCTGPTEETGPCDPIFCAHHTTTRRPRGRRPCRFAKNPALCRRRRRNRRRQD